MGRIKGFIEDFPFKSDNLSFNKTYLKKPTIL